MPATRRARRVDFLVRAIDVPRAVDWVFCTAMFFQGWGNALHLFSRFWWYDNLVHITLPMSLAPILYIGFARLDVESDAPCNALIEDHTTRNNVTGPSSGSVTWRN